MYLDQCDTKDFPPHSSSAGDRLNLVDLAKRAGGVLPPPLKGRTDIDSALPRVLAHGKEQRHKFAPVGSDPYPLAGCIREICWLVGCNGYERTHTGRLDDPYLPINCMCASVRFALLMTRAGFPFESFHA